MGAHHCRRRHRAWGSHGRDRSRASDQCAFAYSLAATWTAFRNRRTLGGTNAPPRHTEGRVIRYALACERGHDFESWFQDSAAYDKQAKRGLVTCPLCGSAKVEKAIMAPRLSVTAKKKPASVAVTTPTTESPA